MSEVFYQINTNGMTFQKIAKTIEKSLIEKGFYPKAKPGRKTKDRTKTIKRDFLADQKIKNDLIKMRVIKDKRNV